MHCPLGYEPFGFGIGEDGFAILAWAGSMRVLVAVQPFPGQALAGDMCVFLPQRPGIPAVWGCVCSPHLCHESCSLSELPRVGCDAPN